MFQRRDLPAPLERVRERHAPGALVLDCERDFETLPPEVAENLAPLVESFEPHSYPAEWLPPDAPDALVRYASDEFTVGMPGDGGVAWTDQTVPPTVFVKARTGGSPRAFLDFLVAEALVQAGLGCHEHFLPFFGERYRDLAAATPLSPADTYQLAVALHEAYVGLHTREVFEDWADDADLAGLHGAWADAGERLEPRLDGLHAEVARGTTSFAAAAEFACSAVKHGLGLPPPFVALDTSAYRQYGAGYAVRWAEKTFETLAEDGNGDDGA